MAGKKALIVWGGWKGHTPEESAKVFKPVLEGEGYHVEVADTLEVYADEQKMLQQDLVVPIWTMDSTGTKIGGLMKAVAAGVGLAGFHGGIIDSFRNNTEYQFMTGGQWVAHPGGCIPEYRVDIVDQDHPITQGIGHFTLKNTEQYYCHTDPANHVLCTTTFYHEGVEEGAKGKYRLGTVMPYAWTRRWVKGKVFVAAWGHTFADFDTPEAKEIVRRGMLWATR
ncbi:MAG: ThuA domain-containing protein [Phycisphaera sp.]|nr:ThuA domain-containing protein [Phycisphaera sp.]